MACQKIAGRRTGCFGKDRARGINLREAHDPEKWVPVFRIRSCANNNYSGEAPTGEPAPGGRCRKVIDTKAPIHDPIAAKPT